MATVNIPSYHDDPNYRYKMPRVKAKVEGRGNGVKTNIMNMADIARALKRAPEYATKFCGCELGASSKFESAEGKAIVNGIHPEADVQTVIDKFVERFVLCPKCKLPEIDLAVVQGRVQGTCNACGYSGDMDNSHKVATFIVKNPPAVNVSTVGKKGSGDKDRTATSGEKRKSSKKERSSTGGGEEGGKKSKSSEKSKRSSDKSSSKKKHGHHHHHHHERQTLNYDSEEIVNVIERLINYLQKGERPTHKDFFQEIRLLQVAQDFGGALRVYCALSALFGADGEPQARLTPGKLEKYEGYLMATCDRSIDGAMILEALENFIDRAQPAETWNDYGVILSTLYQQDLLDEDAILKRYGSGNSGPQPAAAAAAQEQETNEVAVKCTDGAAKTATSTGPDPALARARAHKAAAAFVQWLKEAESASSSESEHQAAAAVTTAPVPSSSHGGEGHQPKSLSSQGNNSKRSESSDDSSVSDDDDDEDDDDED